MANARGQMHPRTTASTSRLSAYVAAVLLALGGLSSCAVGQSGRSPSTKPPTSTGVGNAIDQIATALQSGDFEATLRLCHAALQRSPRDPRAWTLQALAYAGTKNTVAASKSYHHAIEVAPEYLPAWQGMAQLEYAAGDVGAKQTLDHVVSLAPHDPVAHAMLGSLALRGKDCPAAVLHFDQARSVVSSRSDVVLHWSSCLMQMNRAAEAATLLFSALSNTPGDVVLRYDTAVAQWKGGSAAAAQQTLDPLLTAPKPSSDVLALAAQIAEEQNQTQRALDLLRSAILANPRNRDAYLDFARLSYEHASVRVGIDIVNIGLQNLPEDAELYFARGVLLAQNGSMEQAMADLDRASELDPHLSFVGTAQGIAASQAHQFARAEQRLREQTRQHPTDAEAWYLLAEAMAAKPMEPGTPPHQELVHAAEEAVRLNPQSAEAHSQLASIYLRANNAPRAVAECNAALVVHPDDPQTIYQLLLATRKAGPREEIPGLVKRLVAARQAAEERDKTTAKQTLIEVIQTTQAGTP